MVIKIQRGSATCRTPVGYNERKVAQGTATVVGVSNMDGDSIATVLRTFDEYENNPAVSAKTRNMAFHMSINPGAGERMDDGTVMKLSSEVMSGLGYGNQPFIVYRHQDTDREHFHLVSVRVDRDGRVISDSHERRKLQAIMKELGPRYGFVIGKETGRKEEKTPDLILRFNPDAGNRALQMEAITRGCLSYSFSTEKQFELLLARYGARIILNETPSGERMMLQGLDRKGKPVGRPLNAGDLGFNLKDELGRRLEEGKRELPAKHQERGRIRSTVLSCLGYSTSQLHFERMLEKKEISAAFSRNPSGEIFGVTFIDHKGKCVFKGSELGPEISAGLFRNAEEEGHWNSRAKDKSRDVVVDNMPEEKEPEKDVSEKVAARVAESFLEGDGVSQERDIRKKQKRRKGLKI